MGASVELNHRITIAELFHRGLTLSETIIAMLLRDRASASKRRITAHELIK